MVKLGGISTLIHEAWAHGIPDIGYALQGKVGPEDGGEADHDKLFGERTKTSPHLLQIMENPFYKNTNMYKILTELMKQLNIEKKDLPKIC